MVRYLGFTNVRRREGQMREVNFFVYMVNGLQSIYFLSFQSVISSTGTFFRVFCYVGGRPNDDFVIPVFVTRANDCNGITRFIDSKVSMYFRCREGSRYVNGPV